MTSTDPQVVTAAEAARLLGITRQRILELAATVTDFPRAQPAPTGGRVWQRAAILDRAAVRPDPGHGFTGPEIPPLFDHPPDIDRMIDLAAREAAALHHRSVGIDHLVLAMLHPRCPGAARPVLESFGVQAEALRQALVRSMGDPYDGPSRGMRVEEATQRALERANFEAARLADAEVSSEHVLLALASRWEKVCFATTWLAHRGIAAEAVRRRVMDATEGVALPQSPPRRGPSPPDGPDHPGLAGLDLAPNPLGHDPRRRMPWISRARSDHRDTDHHAGPDRPNVRLADLPRSRLDPSGDTTVEGDELHRPVQRA
jgi:hypothetical protein